LGGKSVATKYTLLGLSNQSVSVKWCSGSSSRCVMADFHRHGRYGKIELDPI